MVGRVSSDRLVHFGLNYVRINQASASYHNQVYIIFQRFLSLRSQLTLHHLSINHFSQLTSLVFLSSSFNI